MKQQDAVQTLVLCDLISNETKNELLNNVKREIGIGINITGIPYALTLNYDSELNLTKARLKPELDRDMPSFVTYTNGRDGINPIETAALNYFITTIHEIVLKHKLYIDTDENKRYTYYFKNKEYTLYIDGANNYEFEWEATSRDGKYHIDARQAGYGEYTYQLSSNKGLSPSSSERVNEGTFVDLMDVLLYVQQVYDDEAKTAEDNGSGDTNFLEETLECLNRLNISTDDIICVAYGYDVYMPWDVFVKNADFRYDSGFGNMEISDMIFIYTRDYILYRHEYDGAEEWRAIPTLESIISTKKQVRNNVEVDFRTE